MDEEVKDYWRGIIREALAEDPPPPVDDPAVVAAELDALALAESHG